MTQGLTTIFNRKWENYLFWSEIQFNIALRSEIQQSFYWGITHVWQVFTTRDIL